MGKHAKAFSIETLLGPAITSDALAREHQRKALKCVVRGFSY